jgi:DNA-binding NarL/FixJ family response regulator
VIVEDHVLFEQMFRLTIESVGGVEVLAVAHTAKEGIKACQAHLPDLLLLDLALPDKSGLVVAEALAKCRPEARTIIVSGEADTFQCPKKLRPFIYSVLDKTLPLGEVMREINGLRESLIKNPAPTRDERPLSVREIDILGLIGQGLANKEIAARAFISIQTVQTHRKHIAAKLGVSGAELVRNAVIRAQTLKLAGASDRSVGLHV